MAVKCKVPTCIRSAKVRGYCMLHYKRVWRNGDARPAQPSKVEVYRRSLEHFQSTVRLETDECIIWPFRIHKGYGLLGNRKVHVMACEIEHGPRPTGMMACHGPCHNPACYNRQHVSWGTAKKNVDDRARDGTMMIGEGHANAKLTDHSVSEIRRSYAEGCASQQILAERYGVSQNMISHIILRKKWRHVP